MSGMRHIVTVMRPPESQGTRGQTEGKPEVILKDWPCSIENLSGREVEQARTIFAEASLKVEGYGNPNKRFAERDYLTGGSIGDRKLNIGPINDRQQNGVWLTLLCGERTGG